MPHVAVFGKEEGCFYTPDGRLLFTITETEVRISVSALRKNEKVVVEIDNRRLPRQPDKQKEIVKRPQQPDSFVVGHEVSGKFYYSVKCPR